MNVIEHVDPSGQAVSDERSFGIAEVTALVLGLLLVVAGVVLGLGFTGGMPVGAAAAAVPGITVIRDGVSSLLG